MHAISANLFNGDMDAIFTLFTEYKVTQVDLTHKDVKADAVSLEGLIDLSKRYQVAMHSASGLREFGGNTNHIHEYDMEMARIYIRALHKLNCRILIVTPPTIRSKDINHKKIVDDLRILSNMALPYNINIALKALPWSPYIGTYQEAIALTKEVNSPNFGMALDTFPFLSDSESPDILRSVPFEKVFVVQCSDFTTTMIDTLEELIDMDRSKRLILGEGYYEPTIRDLCHQIRTLGYQGEFSLYANAAQYEDESHESLLRKLGQISLP